jgi:hypothetical protein
MARVAIVQVEGSNLTQRAMLKGNALGCIDGYAAPILIENFI